MQKIEFELLIQGLLGEVNQSRIQYFDVPEKKIASFVTLELAGSFEHLRLMEELSNLPGVIYVEEIS